MFLHTLSSWVLQGLFSFHSGKSLGLAWKGKLSEINAVLGFQGLCVHLVFSASYKPSLLSEL